ncbi:MAG: MoaD/ThiS family protein [Pyrinomonadaceae bacterium]|nr:MoaD/ThiS family protein [Pyrinomonadaceae bacterium]
MAKNFMKVQVLFFGATAEAVGEREIEMDFAAATKSGEAFAEIKRKFPQLNNHSLLFAVNQSYADGGELIKNGDELAVFTAVSGG